MTDEPNKQDEIAALRAEVEALKSALSGKEDKPPPKSTFVPMSDAEWIDKMHQMRERQANAWMPPNAVQEMVAAEPRGFMSGVVHDNRAPTGRPSAIPDSQQPASPRPSVGDGSGWSVSIPLSPPPGVAQADRLMDAADRQDRLELAERLAKAKAI